MKKQVILMFGFMMLFAFTSVNVHAQIPEATTRTNETVETDGNQCKRNTRKNKKACGTKAVKGRRTYGDKSARNCVKNNSKYASSASVIQGRKGTRSVVKQFPDRSDNTKRSIAVKRRVAKKNYLKNEAALETDGKVKTGTVKPVKRIKSIR